MAGVGGAFALWPLIASLNPAADTQAKRKTFSLTDLVGTEHAIVGVAGLPVMIFRRTPEQLLALRDDRSNDVKDRDSDVSIQPTWAKNWHRSLQPEIMVCVANCTREGCVVAKRPEYEPLLLCGCCGARYDFAGRTLTGPGPKNLRVPPYRYVDETTLEFIEAEAPARSA